MSTQPYSRIDIDDSQIGNDASNHTSNPSFSLTSSALSSTNLGSNTGSTSAGDEGDDAHRQQQEQQQLDAHAEEEVCRICRMSDEPATLISPCNCTGSVRKVHTSCLEHWIRVRRPDADTVRRAVIAASLGGESNEAAAAGFGVASHSSDSFTPLQGDDSRLCCELCHAEYRLNVRAVFSPSWALCCTRRSLGHVAEMIIILAMSAVTLSLWPVLVARRNNDEAAAFGPEADRVVFPVVSILLVVLALFTMRKVYKRWRAANSVLHIVPDEESNLHAQGGSEAAAALAGGSSSALDQPLIASGSSSSSAEASAAANARRSMFNAAHGDSRSAGEQEMSVLPSRQ